jgi:uncharacterized protein YprB with RNaseH-like and TPR domain
MKRMPLKISFMLASVLISAMPAFAAGGMAGSMPDQSQQSQKDECILMAKNCVPTDPMRQDSLQQRITRINHEMSKGTAVYTSEELGRLNSQLRDANEQLEFMQSSSGS